MNVISFVNDWMGFVNPSNIDYVEFVFFPFINSNVPIVGYEHVADAGLDIRKGGGTFDGV